MPCLTAKQRKNTLKKNIAGHHIASGTSRDLSDSSLDDEEDEDEQENSLLACVYLSSLKSEGPRGKADTWSKSSINLCTTVCHSKQFPTACYMYHCSQMQECQHKPKKGRHAGAKLWDKDAMYTFDCHGWLFITITEGSDIVNVKFQHKDDHVPYWNIDVPQDVQDLVHNNPSMTPTQVNKYDLKVTV